MLLTSPLGTIVTSLSPRGLTDERVDNLESCLASFRDSGFRPLSVNLAGEIPELERRFPDVQFAVAGNDRIFKERYGPSLGAAFSVCPDDACAVINADIKLLPSNIGEVARRMPEAFFVAHRLDIDRPGGDILGLYRNGIDALYFRKSAYSELLDDPDVCRFQFGAPFWDLVIPVVASFHGPVVFIDPPFILHTMHEARWSQDDYLKLQALAFPAILRHAERHSHKPAARAFLDGFHGCIGRKPDLAERRTWRMAKLLVDQWLIKVEAQTAMRLDVEIGDALSDASAGVLGGPARIGDTPTPRELSERRKTVLGRINDVFKAQRRRRRESIAAGAFASARF